MELRWTEQAALELQQVLQALAERSPDTAKKVIWRIEAAEDALLRFPHMGKSLAYLGYPNDYKLVMKPYVMYYTILDDVIFVLRFLDGRQIIG